MSTKTKLPENEMNNISGGSEIRDYGNPNDPMVTCERYNRGACPYDFFTCQECVTVQNLPGCYCQWKH